MHAPVPRQPLSAVLASLRTRIDQWRSTRSKLGEMPEHLWEEAGRFARRFGINPVASALGLNYYALKERAESSSKDEASAPATSPTFIQFEYPGSPSGCLVELEGPGGWKMTIHLSAAAPIDLGSLVTAFRAQRR